MRAFTTGTSPVSSSCQIPNLRELYTELGLNPNSGTFVEIGAYDGESCSNTSFLADQGWRGVYIEPIPEHCASTRLRHMLNKVTVEPVAIADHDGAAKIQSMGVLTSLSAATKEAYRSIPWASGAAEAAVTVTVKTARLASVLERNDVPKKFELLVVDVEGFEEPIIEQLLDSEWRPEVLVIELIDHHPNFQDRHELVSSAERCRRELISNGFAERYADHINTVFHSLATH